MARTTAWQRLDTPPGGRQTGPRWRDSRPACRSRVLRDGRGWPLTEAQENSGDPFVAEQWSHAQTRRPRTQTKIAFCPQALPWRTGRVWVPCEALHSPPHLAEPCPMTRRRGGAGLTPIHISRPPWLSFAMLLKTGLRSPDSRPGQTPLRKPGSGWGPSQASARGWVSELWDAEA